MSATSTTAKWYAVNTQPHQEGRAERNLQQQGYRVLLPGYWKTRRHARRVDTIRAPLFPGYLFVSLDRTVDGAHAPWRPINSTFGVRRLVTQGDEPAIVPAAFIAALIANCDSEQIFVDPRLRPGAEVRFVAGPFVDVVAKLLHLNDNERVTVLISLMGRDVVKTAQLKDLTLAG